MINERVIFRSPARIMVHDDGWSVEAAEEPGVGHTKVVSEIYVNRFAAHYFKLTHEENLQNTLTAWDVFQ